MNYINNENVKSILSIGDWNVSEDSMGPQIFEAYFTDYNSPERKYLLETNPKKA